MADPAHYRFPETAAASCPLHLEEGIRTLEASRLKASAWAEASAGRRSICAGENAISAIAAGRGPRPFGRRPQGRDHPRRWSTSAPPALSKEPGPLPDDARGGGAVGERRGFVSPNKNLDPDAYADAVNRRPARALQEAKTIRSTSQASSHPPSAPRPGRACGKSFATT